MSSSSIPQDNPEFTIPMHVSRSHLAIADSSWNDTLLIPFYMGTCSFLLLLVFHAPKSGYSRTRLHFWTAEDSNNEEDESESSASLSTRALETSRLISCALLSFLCLFATAHIKQSQDPKVSWRSELAHSILYARRSPCSTIAAILTSLCSRHMSALSPF
jgi:hypothetical protein